MLSCGPGGVNAEVARLRRVQGATTIAPPGVRRKRVQMHEMAVNGEIKTIAAREGSSGIFTGSIEGLYQGYRFGAPRRTSASS